MAENVFCAKEYAKQMRENAVKDNNGNIICSVELWEQIASIVESTTDADVVEVRHGHWIVDEDEWVGGYYTCSVCKCDWTTISGTPEDNNMRYCPECGAKMDGKENGDG